MRSGNMAKSVPHKPSLDAGDPHSTDWADLTNNLYFYLEQARKKLSDIFEKITHLERRLADISVSLTVLEKATKAQPVKDRGPGSSIQSPPSRSAPSFPASSSVFDHLDDGLELVVGDLTDGDYRKPLTAIVQICNCIAVRPHGLSETLAKAYPYSDCYSGRCSISSPADASKKLNRAEFRDRPQPGSIKVCRPSAGKPGPLVVNIYGQFYMGKAINKNLHAKRLVHRLKSAAENDDHLLDGLNQDTNDNRVRWFCQGMKMLVEEVNNGLKVEEVAFPYKIGCGLAGGSWDLCYLPAIKKYAKELRCLGVKTKIVQKVETS